MTAGMLAISSLIAGKRIKRFPMLPSRIWSLHLPLRWERVGLCNGFLFAVYPWNSRGSIRELKEHLPSQEMTCVERSTNGALQCTSQTERQGHCRRRATTGQRSCVRPLWAGRGLITRKQCWSDEFAWRSWRSFKRGAVWARSMRVSGSRRTVAAGSCRATPSPRTLRGTSGCTQFSCRECSSSLY